MKEEREKVERSAGFYQRSFLSVDYLLADYGFQVLRSFFKGDTALELGPASGYMTKHLVKEFKKLHVVEGSLELLNKIPAYANVTRTHAMLEDFETTQKFDTIIMSHVLEHIADPVYVLKRVNHWLHEDGVLLIAVPNAKSIHRLVAVQMGLLKSEFELNERDHELGHYRVYDLASLKQDVVDAGFRVENFGGYFLKPLSNGQIEKNWSTEMIEGFHKVGKFFPENCAEIFVVCKK